MQWKTLLYGFNRRLTKEEKWAIELENGPVESDPVEEDGRKKINKTLTAPQQVMGHTKQCKCLSVRKRQERDWHRKQGFSK